MTVAALSELRGVLGTACYCNFLCNCVNAPLAYFTVTAQSRNTLLSSGCDVTTHASNESVTLASLQRRSFPLYRDTFKISEWELSHINLIEEYKQYRSK